MNKYQYEYVAYVQIRRLYTIYANSQQEADEMLERGDTYYVEDFGKLDEYNPHAVMEHKKQTRLNPIFDKKDLFG